MSVRVFLPGWLCLWILTGVHPGLGQSSWEKALRLAEAGREEEARTLLLELARNQPQNENVQALLGHIAFNGKDYQEAIQRFSLSPSVLAANPSLLVNYAVALLEMKESETARRVLEKIPHQNGIAQFEAAVLLAQLEDYEGAEKHFRLAWRNHPERGIVGYNLAYVQYHLGKFNDSAATLEDTRRDLANSDILNLLALSYIDLEQYEKALNILQEAINKDPLDQRHYVAVAKLCVEGQMPLVGLELLDQGISRLPDAFPLRLQRAYLRLLQSQYQDAELDYRAALQLQPGQGSPPPGTSFRLHGKPALRWSQGGPEGDDRTQPGQFLRPLSSGRIVPGQRSPAGKRSRKPSLSAPDESSRTRTPVCLGPCQFRKAVPEKKRS